MHDFIQQFRQLQLASPRVGLHNIDGHNAEYGNLSRHNKSCYMHIASDYNEDIMHTYWVYRSKDMLDCSYCFDCELSYECTDCAKCYNCDYCQDCLSCTDASYCYGCVGCNNCIGCVGLRHSELHIFNKKFTKEEFEKRKKELTQHEIEAETAKLEQTTPRLYTHTLHNENSTGDYIFHVKNCHACYDTNYAEDCVYIDGGVSGFTDCVDCSFFMDSELCYESVSVTGYNLNFCYICWECTNLEFCELCFGCQDCFGCVGLKSKKFHILNQPYSESEYHKKVGELKEQLKSQNLYNMDIMKAAYPVEDSCINEHL